MKYLILLALVSCSTVPVYKHIYEVMPDQNKLCRYKKLADLANGEAKCFPANAKNDDGSFKFKNTLVITKRALREVLRKQLDTLFGPINMTSTSPAGSVKAEPVEADPSENTSDENNTFF